LDENGEPIASQESIFSANGNAPPVYAVVAEEVKPQTPRAIVNKYYNTVHKALMQNLVNSGLLAYAALLLSSSRVGGYRVLVASSMENMAFIEAISKRQRDFACWFRL
jgi:hypothetical protein